MSSAILSTLSDHAHPTIWNFLQAVYVEQSTTDELILKESYGDAPPAKRARQITKDRRLAHLVEVYDDQDLVSHLDMLRNVMAEEWNVILIFVNYSIDGIDFS